MRYYADDGNAQIEVDADSPATAAQVYVDGGDWGDDLTETTWIDVHVWGADAQDAYDADETGDVEEPDRETHTVTLEPEEPPCGGDHEDHDWRSPLEIVGGIAENPGVWGHGGGVTISEVCMHCGCRRVTDTWAQRSDTGEQGLKSIAYEPGYYSERLAELAEAE